MTAPIQKNKDRILARHTIYNGVDIGLRLVDIDDGSISLSRFERETPNTRYVNTFRIDDCKAETAGLNPDNQTINIQQYKQ